MGRAARKWKNALPWVLLCCMVFTAAMGVYTFCLEKDSYRATYSFYALPGKEDAGEAPLEASRMLVRDCRELASTESFRADVLSRCESDGQCRVSVNGMDGTHIIRVEITGPSPAVVQALANAAGRELMARAGRELMALNAVEVEAAVLPEKPFAPRRVWKTLWMLAASFAAFSLLGCLLGSDERRVRADSDGGFRPFGSVSDYRGELRHYLNKQKKTRGNSTLSQCVNRLVKEEVRALAIALRTEKPRVPMRSLVITSIGAAECKDSLCVLLASELAEEGFRVLLMELDGYSPHLGELLGVCGQHDALDYLEGTARLGNVVVDTPVRGLSFIDYRHEAELVARTAASEAFAQFIHTASQSFDYVLLNAPASGVFNDAAMLGAVADTTLLLAKDGRYRERELHAATETLSRMVKRLLGVVLVQTTPKERRWMNDFDNACDKRLKDC